MIIAKHNVRAVWYYYTISMTRSKVRLICKNCNKEYFPHYTSYGIYCSLKCQYDFTRKRNITLWLDGKINSLNTNGVIKPFVRRYIFEKYDSKCMLCGWNKVNKSTNLIPLEIDHVDGNYKNNDLSNLRLLCPNCHSLTSTYKNSNKGKGRANRTRVSVKI